MTPGPRPFRFGLMPRPWDPDTWPDLARRVESIGFSTLVLADHFADGSPPPLSPLVAAAAATSRLRLGTFVLNNDFHHPAWLAREAAALDRMSDGRFELGLGAGHMKSEYDQVGLAFERPGVRIDRLTEAVDIITRLLAGESVTHAGTHYHLDDHRCFPRPAVPIPLLIGGNGRRVLQLAATRADIVGFTGFSQREGTAEVDLNRFTAAGLDDRVAVVRAAAGDRFDELELNSLVQGVVVTDDRRAAAQKVVDGRQLAISVDDVLDSPFLLIGTHDEIAEQLIGARERFGISYVVVFEPALGSMAPVVERLAGS